MVDLGCKLFFFLINGLALGLGLTPFTNGLRLWVGLDFVVAALANGLPARLCLALTVSFTADELLLTLPLGLEFPFGFLPYGLWLWVGWFQLPAV